MEFKYLKISKDCSNDTLNLLKHNVIGTPGESMLYQHTDVSEKVNHIKNPIYIELKTKSSTVGTCCFCDRVVKNNNEIAEAKYIRFFTFKASFRSKTKNQKFRLRKANSSLKREIDTVFSNSFLGSKTVLKSIFYAYLDPKNKRSAKLCSEFGFEKARSFSAIIFSRFFPKKKLSYERIDIGKREEVELLLDNFYKEFNFYNTENTFFKNGYYVVKDSAGNILAGVHAHKEKWEILNLPGLSGRFLQLIVPKIPILNRLFSKHFEFLSLESIYYSHNNPNTIEQLIESLLHDFGLNKALTFADTSSFLAEDLNKLNLGFLDKINKEAPASVMVRSKGLTKKVMKELMTAPAYISTFDLS